MPAKKSIKSPALREAVAKAKKSQASRAQKGRQRKSVLAATAGKAGKVQVGRMSQSSDRHRRTTSRKY